jgi:heat shock protein 4
MICKLKARLNLHGVLNVEQGYYVEDQEIEEPIPEEKKEGDVSTTPVTRFARCEEEAKPMEVMAAEFLQSHIRERAAKRPKIEPLLTTRQAMDTDKANGEATAPKTRKVKKQVRKGDLPLSTASASLDQSIKDSFLEKEGQMISEDKLVAETEDKKNELESEIYAMRGKIDESYESNGYADFASDAEKQKIREKCEQLEVSSMELFVKVLTLTSSTGLALRRR